MNVIDLIKEDAQRHKATVKLPGEKKEKNLFLIEITAKTSELEDFKKTFRNLNSTQEKLAQSIFGKIETSNIYGVFLDESFKMIFAFNRSFADYNKDNKCIFYKDPNDIIFDRLEKQSGIFTLPPEKKVINPKRKDSQHEESALPQMVLKYSLPE